MDSVGGASFIPPPAFSAIGLRPGHHRFLRADVHGSGTAGAGVGGFSITDRPGMAHGAYRLPDDRTVLLFRRVRCRSISAGNKAAPRPPDSLTELAIWAESSPAPTWLASR